MTADRLPELRFRLPGRWWQVPLSDAAAAREGIRALVREQLGRADDQASLREALSRRMLAALQDAIAGNGLSLQIALSIVDDVPLPVTMAVLLPDIGMTPSIGTSPAAVIGVLEQTMRTGGRLDSVSRFSIRESEVLRSHRIASAASDPRPDSPESQVLLADYWVTVPGTKRVLLITFSSSLVDIADVMLEFFDSILAASYWHAEPVGAELSAAEPAR